MSVVDDSFDLSLKLEERAAMPLAGGMMQQGYQSGANFKHVFTSPYVKSVFVTFMSDSNVAQFKFGSIDAAYATQMGHPQNVGVIGCRIYREKPKPPPLDPGLGSAAPAPASQLSFPQAVREDISGRLVLFVY